MITLHILQLLADNGFGTIDESLFWEKLPAKTQDNQIVTGVAIYSRGFPVARGTRLGQNFDLYSRGTTDLAGADILEAIAEFIDDNYATQCVLPEVPNYSAKEYVNVTVTTTGNVENLGLDENDRVVFRLAGQIKYQRLRSN